MKITNKWLRFFVAIGNEDCDSISKIARDHDATYSYVSKLIRDMEHEGLIRIEKDSHNKRIKGKMIVTRKGEEILRAIIILDDNGLVMRR